MRPVNLIPPDERRGDSAPLRTGALIYVLTGGLAVLLLLMAVVALTGKQVSDREAEKASLEQELQQVSAEAQNLKAFTDFRTIQQQRADTVSSLAQTRFDWPRVLHELALVLPSDISLSSLTGTVSPSVELDSGASGSSSGTALRPDIAGPALEITGCAPSQDGVAGFVASLEDIDGVTRVGVASSGQGDQASSSASTSQPAAPASGGSDQCPPGQTFEFEIVVAFDAVPAPATATTSPSVPAPAAPPETGGDPQVASAQTQENVARASVREQTSKAENAKSTVMPGG